MSTSWFMKSYSDWLSHEKTNTFTVTNIYEIGACCEFNYLSHNVNANRKYSVHTLILKKNIFKSDTFKKNLMLFFYVLLLFCFFICFFFLILLLRFFLVRLGVFYCLWICLFYSIFVMCLMLCENVYIIWVIII